MITDIIDFLPIYPDMNDTNFNMDIYTKKEFYDNKLEKYEEPPVKPGILLQAQKIISMFLSSRTLYPSLLITWKMGVGKTAAAIGAIEQIKTENSSFTGALIFAKGDTIIDNFKEEIVFNATKGQYIPENYNELTPETQVTRKNKLLKDYYSFYTFETFASKQISKSSDEYLIETFSNKIIVIDEVHNIRLQDIKNKKKKNKKKNPPVLLYKNFHRFLHLIKNCKIILLSGTPIKDRIDEIASVMNLILPLDEQLPNDKEFINIFFNKDPNYNVYKIKPEKIAELKSKFNGRVSYLEAVQSEVKKEYVGEKIGNLKHFIVYPDRMSEFQTKYYNKAFDKDNKSNKLINTEFIYEDDNDYEDDNEDDDNEEIDFVYEDDEDSGNNIEIDGVEIEDEDIGRFSTNSRQASLFVYPDGSYGKSGFVSSAGWISHSKNKTISNKTISTFSLTNKFRTELQNNTLEKIRNLSSKYASVIENILRDYKLGKSSFVYCEYVEGSGGILFSLLLNLFGFSKYNGKISLDEYLKSGMRYAIINNKVASSNEVKNIIKRFNDPSNKYGKKINVIIGSKVISEGVSLKNVQAVHILTPHWNYSETSQAIARGYRFGSHEELIKAGVVPEFKIYQYVSLPNNNTISIDLKMYEISEVKDVNIKRVEQIIKESAFDCALTYKRNFIQGFDNERECNYTSCDYNCDQINMKYIKDDIKPILDLSSYQVYYNTENIDKIIYKLKTDIFRYIFEIDFDTLVNKFNIFTPFDILTSLRKIINYNIPINNKYNIQSYLREENNIYFLVDSITSEDNYMSTYYNKNLIINQDTVYNDILTDIETMQLPKFIENIFDTEDSSVIYKIIDKLDIELKEMLLEYSFISKEMGLTNKIFQRDKILEYFNFAIETIDDITVSTLLYFYKKILRCYTIENGWQTCDDSFILKFNENKKEKKVSLKENEYFGTYSDDDIKKFCIVRSNNSEDKRQENSGRICHNSWDKPVLFHLIVNIFQIPLEEIIKDDVIVKSKWASVKDLNRTKLINGIISSKFARICTYNENNKSWDYEEYTEDILNEQTDNDLKKMLYCSKIKKEELCSIIKVYFKNEDILEYDATCGSSNKQKK